MPDLYLLFESASGYALFQKQEFEQIGLDEQTVQDSLLDYASFRQAVTLKAFLPFSTAEDALEQIQAVSSGEASEMLINFLKTNLPKMKKNKDVNFQVGVSDAELGRSLVEVVPCITSEVIREMLRCCRVHFNKFGVTEQQLDKARLGLAHSYSRTKMQFDPNRQDKPIINAIALLDGLDKNINTFAMRVKEWYAWHFPELTKLVTDNAVYCRVCVLIGIRDSFDMEANKEVLEQTCGSEEIAEQVIRALNISMGQDIAQMDWVNIERWANQVLSLVRMRDQLTNYLNAKLNVVSPNLTTLIGDRVAARLIAHAGSLTSLAKLPSSTVQILGAEKALFRALKTKGNTPKYGLIFHSTFIGRAVQKNKGRISRYLANKCALASRIDCFADNHTTIFGNKMKDQIEERLRFLVDGVQPRRNVDVMREAMEELASEISANADSKPAKRKAEAVDEGENVAEPAKKKKKKNKTVEVEVEAPVEVAENASPEKKKKKKNKTVAVEEKVAEVPEVVEVEKKKKKKKNKENVVEAA